MTYEEVMEELEDLEEFLSGLARHWSRATQVIVLKYVRRKLLQTTDSLEEFLREDADDHSNSSEEPEY